MSTVRGVIVRPHMAANGTQLWSVKKDVRNSLLLTREQAQQLITRLSAAIKADDATNKP